MEILRAKTLELRQTGKLTPAQAKNSKQNRQEALSGNIHLSSYPRRLVFELTSACNLNCIMCGRNAAEFKNTYFDTAWLKKFEGILPSVEEVTLMGWGEPTIHPAFVRILDWAHQNGLRKYFCTNGMLLDKLYDDIFKYKVDIIAVSVDGATSQMNDLIRRGGNLEQILRSIERITDYKTKNNLTYPYTNFVFTAMKQNIAELPLLVQRAGEIGMDEVKVVFLTAFSEDMHDETLYYHMDLCKDVFAQAEAVAEACGVALKLPHLVGEDPADALAHKPCFTAWRDFFLGSDGYVRPCMSTAQKLFDIEKYASFDEMWNSPEYEQHRRVVNSEAMAPFCRNCYQSSFANWNKQDSFIQIGNDFSPDWEQGALVCTTT